MLTTTRLLTRLVSSACKVVYSKVSPRPKTAACLQNASGHSNLVVVTALDYWVIVNLGVHV
jgi:hypothetical protein